MSDLRALPLSLALALAAATPAGATDFFKPARLSKATTPAPEYLYSTLPVTLNAEALSAMAPGDAADLALPNGKTYRVVLTRTESHANGDLSWIGRLEGFGPEMAVIATMGANGSYAEIQTPDGPYGVVPGGAHDWLFDVSLSQLHQARPAGQTDALVPPLELGPVPKADPVCADITSKPGPQTTIDVMAVLAPDFVSAHGAANVETRLNSIVTNINNYYNNSNIAMTLRRVATVNVNYGSATSIDDSTALNAITNGAAPFANIAALRNYYGADMVMLMRGPQGGGGISGVAWIGGFNTSPITGSVNFMYSVNGDAPGFSGTLVAHELGHNMGNNHDRANAGGDIGVTSYSFGYTVCGTGAIAGCPTQSGFNNAGTGFGTIMSYYRPTVARFSSPNYTCTGPSVGGITATCGLPGGNVSSADTVRAMNCVRSGIAGMKTAHIADCSNAATDTDGDGLPDCMDRAAGRNQAVKDNDIFGQSMLFTLQQYRDFLAREADPTGLDFWMGAINAGTQTRGNLVETFFNSAEFQVAIAPVVRLYFAYFLRIPDYPGLQFWIGQFNSGSSLDTISQAFASSPEFSQTYGALTNSQFVNLVYQNILGRPADAGGLAFWTGQLDSSAMNRGQVMAAFSESAEYKGVIGNSVYVTMMYVGMLRRSPDQGGFDFWKGYLTSGNSGLALINGFITSTEYRNRFLP